MANNTKILRYDLGEDLSMLLKKLDTTFEELDRLKGATNQVKLDVLFQKINVNMLADEEKAIMRDLIQGFNQSKKHISERVVALEESLKAIEQYEIDKNETYTYDAYGNVKTQVVKRLNASNSLVDYYTVTYYYLDESAGKLNYSEKKFKNTENRNVTIRKVYGYTGDDIVSITTRTTVSD